MSAMILLFKLCLLCIPIFSLNEPIMNLDLTLTVNHELVTTFSIGKSQINVFIDINKQGLDICCKNSHSVFQKVYYYLINPFKQNQDYSCKSNQDNHKSSDLAIFNEIGPINVKFNEIVFPKCEIGVLGFNKESQILQLMPVSQQFFRIYPQTDQKIAIQWKLEVGGTIKNNYHFFKERDSADWEIDVYSIKFDQNVIINSPTIKFITSQYFLGIPSQYYKVIQKKLVDSYLCEVRNSYIYCPCTAGISSSFPKFQILFNQSLSYYVNENRYLMQNDQICTSILKQINSSVWEINIMLLDKIDILFDFKEKRIGIGNSLETVAVNELINQPLQLILNCFVVLLMCFFVAMIITQIVKHVINIEGRPYESFETYMMKRSQ